EDVMGERQRSDTTEEPSPKIIEIAAIVGRLPCEAQHDGEEILGAMRQLEERETKVLLGGLLPRDVHRGRKNPAPASVGIDRLQPDPIPTLGAVGGVREI